MLKTIYFLYRNQKRMLRKPNPVWSRKKTQGNGQKSTLGPPFESDPRRDGQQYLANSANLGSCIPMHLNNPSLADVLRLGAAREFIAISRNRAGENLFKGADPVLQNFFIENVRRTRDLVTRTIHLQQSRYVEAHENLKHISFGADPVRLAAVVKHALAIAQTNVMYKTFNTETFILAFGLPQSCEAVEQAMHRAVAVALKLFQRGVQADRIVNPSFRPLRYVSMQLRGAYRLGASTTAWNRFRELEGNAAVPVFSSAGHVAED